MASPEKLPNGTWRARVVIDGQRHSKTFPLRRQAADWLREQQVDAKRGKFIPPDRLREKVGDRLDVWLAEKEAHPSFTDGSLRVYRSAVENHIRPAFGDLTMEQLTAERIRTWQYRLAEEVSTSRAKEAMVRLGSFLSSQLADGYLTQHPFDRIKDHDRVKHRPREMTILEPHELHAVVAALDPEWAKDTVLGLAFIGCRVGDLARLRPEDWDRVNDRLFVRDKKTGNDRRLPVFPAVREVLERCVTRGGDYLFMTGSMTMFDSSEFARAHFKSALEAAGVSRRVRVHDLRHTCASWLIKQGFGPVHVAAYLGHANPTTTMSTYSHLFADDMADMGSALDSMWQRAHEKTNVTRLRPSQEAQ